MQSERKSSMDNDRLVAEAQSWAINAQWRTVKHRYGVRGKGFVRVARVPPEECMEQLLAYLTSEDGAKGMYLDGKPLTDEWLPLTAWYERVQAPNRTETVEVYQALRHVSDATADGPVVVEDGRTYIDVHEFYWAVKELPVLPKNSEGKVYNLTSIRRDEESGTFSCVLVTRTELKALDEAVHTMVTALDSITDETSMNLTDDEVNALILDAPATVANSGAGYAAEQIEYELNDDGTIKTDAEGKPVVKRCTPASDGITNAGVIVERAQQKTPGGLTTVQQKVRSAKKADLKLKYATDDNGNTAHTAWFRNYTLAEMLALQKQYTHGSVQMNDYGLYDGTMSRTVEGASQSGGTELPNLPQPYDKVINHEKYNIVEMSGNIWKVTDAWQTREGVVNDNADAAFKRIEGAEMHQVRHIYKGYYSYSATSSHKITYVSAVNGETIENGKTAGWREVDA